MKQWYCDVCECVHTAKSQCALHTDDAEEEECPECEGGDSPWYDYATQCWVHTQDGGEVVTCNCPPDED